MEIANVAMSSCPPFGLTATPIHLPLNDRDPLGGIVERPTPFLDPETKLT
jgi:hypothetical protein